MDKWIEDLMDKEVEWVNAAEREPHVCIGGDEWIKVVKVKVLDIEEDYTGRDLITFLYKGKKRTSYVTLRFAQ